MYMGGHFVIVGTLCDREGYFLMGVYFVIEGTRILVLGGILCGRGIYSVIGGIVCVRGTRLEPTYSLKTALQRSLLLQAQLF